MSFSGFRQTRGEGWFRIGEVECTTTVIVTALSVISLIVYAASTGLLGEFVLSSEVTSGKVWQLITWPLANTPDAFVVIISFFFFFVFSSDLERQLGKRRYLRFLLLLTLVPALIEILFISASGNDYAAYGLNLLSAGIIVAYVAVYPTARTFFDIPFWVLVVAFLGIDALAYTGNRQWPGLVFLLLLAGTGLILSRSFGLSRLTWIPNIPLPSFLTGDSTPRPKKQKSKLKVVSTDDINAILDKVSQHGVDSLSRDERKRLDDYSRGSQSN